MYTLGDTEQYCSYYNEVIILQLVLMGIWCFLIFPTALEFMIAQSPEHMRGLMVGMCYASLGIGAVLYRFYTFKFSLKVVLLHTKVCHCTNCTDSVSDTG